MVKLTMLARVADGLPLAEGLDSDRQQDLEHYKQQAKTLFKKLSQGPPPPSRMSYESGPYFLHYMVWCALSVERRGEGEPRGNGIALISCRNPVPPVPEPSTPSLSQKVW